MNNYRLYFTLNSNSTYKFVEAFPTRSHAVSYIREHGVSGYYMISFVCNDSTKNDYWLYDTTKRRV